MHVPVAVDVAAVLTASAFCFVVFLLRAATHSRHADLVAAGMVVACAALTLRGWGALLRLHEAPEWLTWVTLWMVAAAVALFWYELRPVFIERRGRLL